MHPADRLVLNAVRVRSPQSGRSHAEISEATGLDRPSLRQALARLRRDGRLTRVGETKAARWYRPSKVR